MRIESLDDSYNKWVKIFPTPKRIKGGRDGQELPDEEHDWVLGTVVDDMLPIDNRTRHFCSAVVRYGQEMTKGGRERPPLVICQLNDRGCLASETAQPKRLMVDDEARDRERDTIGDAASGGVEPLDPRRLRPGVRQRHLPEGKEANRQRAAEERSIQTVSQ